jgi:TolB-like protein/DNA-binding winged helix-turn-helix (wHTH) protein
VDEVTPTSDRDPHRRTVCLEIGDLIVDVRQRRVTRNGMDLKLPALSFDLLAVLSKVAPEVMSVSRLMETVWPHAVVTPETVSQRVKLLRQALGDDASSARYVASVRGRGYCVVADVVEVSPAAECTSKSTPATPPVIALPHAGVSFCDSYTTQTNSPGQQFWSGTCRATRRAAVWLTLGLMTCIDVLPLTTSHWRLDPFPVVRSTNDRLIAILPFTDLSEAKDQGYVVDGLADEIRISLSKVPDLETIDGTSSTAYRETYEELRQIRSELGARFALEGSVRRSGDRISVTAELVETRDGAQHWSIVYDRTFTDVIAVENEIAINLARALRIEVLSAAQPNSIARSTAATETYLQGLHAADRFDQQGFEEAIAAFRRSLELSPTFSSPAESLALTLGFATLFGFLPPQAGFYQAQAVAVQALKLAPHSAIPHVVLSMVRSGYDYDWTAARQEADAALALEPNNAIALLAAAHEGLADGRWTYALDELNAALTIDPLNASAYIVKCWTYLRLGRLAEAESACRRALQLSPTFAFAHYELGIVLLTEKKREAALEEMRSEFDRGAQLAGLVLAYDSLHQKEFARDSFARLKAVNATRWPMSIAGAYAYEGDKDRAFAWLAKAYMQRDPALLYIKGNPLLKKLEGDPRYILFLRRMGLPN